MKMALSKKYFFFFLSYLFCSFFLVFSPDLLSLSPQQATGTLFVLSLLFSLFSLQCGVAPLNEIMRGIEGFNNQSWSDLTPFMKKQGSVGKMSRSLQGLYTRLTDFIRQLREAKGGMRLLLGAIQEGVIKVDRNGIISYTNSQSHHFLRLKREKETLPFTQSFLNPEGKIETELNEIFHECVEKKTSIHRVIELKESTQMYLEVRAIPSAIDGGILFVLQDRSFQYKAVELGKEFIANASHELRTPVTIIKGFAETLKDLSEISEAMFHSILEKILRNCERMEFLVKNLLILADLDNTVSLKKERCSLPSMIENISYQVLAIYPDAYIETLLNEDEIWILVNHDLFELALTNLLQNGVKYSKSPAKITITIEQKETEVLICIEDRGMGIPQESLEYIFNRFYNVNKSHSRKLG